MSSYAFGSRIQIETTFTDDTGDTANPTNVYCTIREPDGTETIYTYGTDPEIEHPSKGVFNIEITGDQEGKYVYWWHTDIPAPLDTVQATDEGHFRIRQSTFD